MTTKAANKEFLVLGWARYSFNIVGSTVNGKSGCWNFHILRYVMYVFKIRIIDTVCIVCINEFCFVLLSKVDISILTCLIHVSFVLLF